MLGYYDRFNPAKNYESLQFRAGNVLQSAELNEIQSTLAYRTKGLGDALFKDGDIVRDCRAVVNPLTGETFLESGAIYIDGAVRGIAPATLTIPTVGSVSLGVYLTRTTVTELDDPELRDPASMSRNYLEAGAARLKVEITWGYSTDGDTGTGEFYPVYSVEDGSLLAKEAPPNMDSVVQALARYDRDSAGGTYVVEGMEVRRLDDLEDGRQVYTVLEGRCRVNGYGIEQATARRLVFNANPDLRLITSEPHQSTTELAQTFKVAQGPINDITQITMTVQKTANVTHGGYAGVADPLPNTSVLEIVSVVQGGTTYVAGTDFRLTGDTVDWSLGGAEPATGSSYTVVYRHISTAVASVITDESFTISGAVPGSLVMVTYHQKLPRIDTLAIMSNGDFTWLRGVSTDWNPQPPTVPQDMLALATIKQTWRADYELSNNAVRVVPMNELAKLNSRIDLVVNLLAQQRLESSAGMIDAGLKRGLFVDPFLDDSLRDQGVTQNGAVFDGELTLPVDVVTVGKPTADVTAPAFLSISTRPYAIQQWARTGDMLVNPYQAFEPIPAVVTLTPAVDRWTEHRTIYASSITQNITQGSGVLLSRRSSTSTQTLSVTNTALQFLRQIPVQFSIKGFGPGETLTSVTFDGIPVTPTP